jgi:hypothetical protein
MVMHLAFSSLFSLNATSAVRSIAIIDSRACGYAFEASGPVPFEAELLLQTRIHPFNSSSPRPALFCKALKTTGQLMKALIADSQFSSRKLREQLSAHGVGAVISYPANQSKGEAKLLRVDKYFRTHGPVVEKQIYNQGLEWNQSTFAKPLLAMACPLHQIL